MEKIKNTVGIVSLVLILLIFIVGGFFAMKVLTKEKKNEDITESNIEGRIDIREDKSKDYIYYENGEEIIESEEIESYDVYFNFKELHDVNTKLKSEMDTIRKTIKYTKDMGEIPEGANVNDEGIYSLEYRDYQDFNYGDYVSLLVLDYEYDIIKGSNPINIESYVVEKETGKRVTGDVLLEKYNTNMDAIKEKVKTRLQDLKLLNDAILVDETMNNFNTFALYINKKGELAITFVVKTSENNYNDSIVLS